MSIKVKSYFPLVFEKSLKNLQRHPGFVIAGSRNDCRRYSTPCWYFHLKCARLPLGNLSVGQEMLFLEMLFF